MAATVTWDGLRELASFKAEKGLAVSVYIDLDPSTTPHAAHAQTHVNAMLDEAARVVASNHPELTHDQKQALKADVERIRRYFAEEFDRDGSRGAAVFVAGLDNFWQPLPLTEPVPDEVKVDREFLLAPLVPLVGRGEGALVAVVGRERGDVYRLRAGRLEELVQLDDEVPGQHDQGGWSQARYQRHIDHLAAEHMRRVAEQLDRWVRRLRYPRVIVVSTEETRGEFSELLSNDVRGALIGWTQAEAHSQAPQLLEVVTPMLQRWRTEQENEKVGRWSDETGRNGRAAAGWAATLEAVSDGRVELLLYRDRVERTAWRCPSCWRLSIEGSSCPLDGTALERRDDGLDLAIHRTLAHGGTAWAVRHRDDLDPVEGIGAILRY